MDKNKIIYSELSKEELDNLHKQTKARADTLQLTILKECDELERLFYILIDIEKIKESK